MKARTTALTVALLLGLVAAGCLPPPGSDANNGGNVNQPPPSPTAPPVTEVKITYPEKDASVDLGETVRGTYQNVPAGQKIWVVVYIPKVNRYYPQAEPAELQADSTWSSATTFGVPSDSGLKFEAIAVLANANAQNALRTYLDTSKAKKSYIGMERLPDGATRQHSVTVTRR